MNNVTLNSNSTALVSNIQDIPYDALGHVLSYFTLNDIVALEITSKPMQARTIKALNERQRLEMNNFFRDLVAKLTNSEHINSLGAVQLEVRGLICSYFPNLKLLKYGACSMQARIIQVLMDVQDLERLQQEIICPRFLKNIFQISGNLYTARREPNAIRRDREITRIYMYEVLNNLPEISMAITVQSCLSERGRPLWFPGIFSQFPAFFKTIIQYSGRDMAIEFAKALSNESGRVYASLIISEELQRIGAIEGEGVSFDDILEMTNAIGNDLATFF